MIYIAGISISVFISALLLSKKNKSRADFFLFMWVLALAFHLFLYYINLSSSPYKIPHFLGLEIPFPLIHGPLLYLYVVAVMPGSDVRLKNEYVVLGAHLDHFGIGKAIKGDSIYNGMMDNASGVSALLSISKAFNEFNIRTKRSVIFVLYTAEENGLLGSSYFVNKTTIKEGKMVANINIDMLSQTIETAGMAPLGYSHSNLSAAADFAAQQLNLKIDDNSEAEAAYIERSDQISFIKEGVPALFIAGGFTALDPKKNGEKVFNKWMKKRYHSPFDDLDQPYSEKAFQTAIRFNFLTTYFIANVLKEIKWDKESWLFKKYASGM